MCFLLGPAGERGGEEGSAALPSSCPNLWTPSSYSFWWHWGPPSDGEAPRLHSNWSTSGSGLTWASAPLPPPQPRSASQVSRENPGLASEPSLRARSCSPASHVHLVFGCCWHLCQALMASRSLPSHPQITLSWPFLVQCILLPLASADALSRQSHFPAGFPLPHPGLEEVRLLRSQPFLRKALYTQPHTVMGRPGQCRPGD